MSPFRILPRVNPDTQFFWTSGATGELRFLRCGDCQYYIHPPTPVCPRCLSRNVAPDAVSGRASVATYTVNYQPWIPGYDPPYREVRRMDVRTEAPSKPECRSARASE